MTNRFDILTPAFHFMIIIFIGMIQIAEGKTESSAGSMKWLGVATIKIKTVRGEVIYIDPYAGSDYADSADIVLITHEHSDHNNLSLVKLKSSSTVIRSAQAYQNGAFQSFVVGDIKIKAVPAYNYIHAYGACVGFVVEFDSVKIYHAGDTGLIPEMANLASEHITYALLPIDITYTMSPAEAQQADSMIAPVYAIPIHNWGVSTSLFAAPNRIIMSVGETIQLSTPTNVDDKTDLTPQEIRLHQNYPNPFNSSTTIHFHLPAKSFVQLKIYDVLGKEIAVLANEERPADDYAVHWNGGKFPSGMYLICLQTDNFIDTKKAILLK
jgi:L-ascorbate metabolism protein UlaG (beta-lactamase superfamily)